MVETIAAFGQRMNELLRHAPNRDRLVQELTDHLHDAEAALEARGEPNAEAQALANFGAPEAIAFRILSEGGSLGLPSTLFAFSALAGTLQVFVYWQRHHARPLGELAFFLAMLFVLPRLARWPVGALIQLPLAQAKRVRLAANVLSVIFAVQIVALVPGLSLRGFPPDAVLTLTPLWIWTLIAFRTLARTLTRHVEVAHVS